MLEHIAEFTAWPILAGIFIGYIANHKLHILRSWCSGCVVSNT